MAYAKRSYSEIAVETTLNGGINDSVESFAIASSTGWPSGSGGNFYARIGSETIDCASRSGTTVTVQSGGRGALSTSAAAHTSGVAVTLVFTSGEADEANYAVSKTVGKATAVGQILVVDATNSFAAVQAKTSGQVLIGNGTTLASVALSGDVTVNSSGVTAIGASKVTSSMIVDATIATGDIADLAVTQAKIEAAQQFEAGDVKWTARSSPTTGWLLCDGSSVLRATYAALFSAIGTTFGSADGTHFTLPDGRGRAPVGVGTGSGLTARALADSFGAETVTLTGPQSGIAQHTHVQTAHTHTQNSHNHTQDSHFHLTPSLVIASPLGRTAAGDAGEVTGLGASTAAATATNQAATATSQNTTAVNQDAGPTTAASSHANVQPSLALNLFIKI